MMIPSMSSTSLSKLMGQLCKPMLCLACGLLCQFASAASASTSANTGGSSGAASRNLQSRRPTPLLLQSSQMGATMSLPASSGNRSTSCSRSPKSIGLESLKLDDCPGSPKSPKSPKTRGSASPGYTEKSHVMQVRSPKSSPGSYSPWKTWNGGAQSWETASSSSDPGVQPRGVTTTLKSLPNSSGYVSHPACARTQSCGALGRSSGSSGRDSRGDVNEVPLRSAARERRHSFSRSPPQSPPRSAGSDHSPFSTREDPYSRTTTMRLLDLPIPSILADEDTLNGWGRELKRLAPAVSAIGRDQQESAFSHGAGGPKLQPHNAEWSKCPFCKFWLRRPAIKGEKTEKQKRTPYLGDNLLACPHCKFHSCLACGAQIGTDNRPTQAKRHFANDSDDTSECSKASSTHHPGKKPGCPRYSDVERDPPKAEKERLQEVKEELARGREREASSGRPRAQ